MSNSWLAFASLCITVFASAMSVVWRFGHLGQRIEQLTTSVDRLVGKIDTHAENIGDLRIRVAILESKNGDDNGN